MASNTYTPNPLRPYYIPPAHDYLTGKLSSPSSLPSASSIPNSTSVPAVSSSSFSAALSDLDYFESPSVTDVVKGMIDTAIMRYTSVIVLQPFKVAKTVMQCQYVPKRKKVKESVEIGVEGVEGGNFEEFGNEWKGFDQEVYSYTLIISKRS